MVDHANRLAWVLELDHQFDQPGRRQQEMGDCNCPKNQWFKPPGAESIKLERDENHAELYNNTNSFMKSVKLQLSCRDLIDNAIETSVKIRFGITQFIH